MLALLSPKTPQQTLVDHQIMLEKLYSKNQLTTRIRAEFLACEELNFTAELVRLNIPVNFGLDVLVQMAIHKRANLETMIGILNHHFNDPQITADMLVRAAIEDMMTWDPGTELFIVMPHFQISQDVQDEIDKFQYPLPMVVEPLNLSQNKDSGYYLNKGSVILKDNHHNDDVCLDHLNRANAVRFTINEDTALMVKNRWRNLDKAKVGETREKFELRKKAFNKYDRIAKDVMALLMQESNSFYLTHKYDKRGRCYCQGYQVNYQGTPWNKAVVEFADKEIVE